MLNILARTARPDTMMAVHQCARHNEAPKLSHEKIVKRIVKCLIDTKHVGIEAKIDLDLCLVPCADSDFANGWNKTMPEKNENRFPGKGYVMYLAGMPIAWCSKLQSRIDLSSAESEHASLSTCLRDAIPIMNFVKEISCHEKYLK